MKLTKDVVEVLKYHGYMTFTESTETFLARFDTVEELGNAGFITDRGAINFLNTVFDENGVNRSAEVGEDELEKQAVIEPEPIESEPINPEPIEPEVVTPEPIVEPENGPIDVQNPEPTPEDPTPEEPTPEPENEQEPTQESNQVAEELTQNPPEDAPVVDPTPKKTTTKKTTTKKTTKKES